MAVQVLTTQPNWTTPVLERLEWKTEVLKSRKGTEQRIKLREHPRHLMEYDFLVYKEEYRALQTQLLRWQGAKWIIPLWMHSQQLTAQAVIGSTRIYLKTATYEFQVDSHVHLSISPTQSEYLPVYFVGENYIDLSAPVTRTWPVGTLAVPARYGRLASSIKISGITSEVVTGTLQVNLDNTKAFTDFVATYVDSLLYFGDEPNRANTLNMEWSRNQAVLDYGTGPVTTYDLQGYSEIIRSYEYLSLNRASQNKIRSLLSHCKGMRSPFLIPTFQADISVPAGLSLLGTGSTLQINSVNYEAYMRSRLTYPYLRIELNNAAPLVMRVQSATPPVNGLEQLSFTKPFGVAFKSENIKRISYVNMSRLDSDSVEFNWTTPNIVSMAVPIRGIPE